MKILILAGGRGTRLWPLVDPPKQFALGDGQHTLLQKTLLRFLKGYEPSDLVILTQKEFVPLAREQADSIADGIQILPEIEGRDTAPALLHALEHFDDDAFFVTPSDHIIAPEQKLLDAVELAKAQEASAVLFGIYPSSPNTQYGYIVHEESNVTSFIEKPNSERAMALLEKGNVLWNSGMLFFHRKAFLAEVERVLSGSCPALSIDRAFLEHFAGLKVLPLALSWSDVGTWESIYQAQQKDENGNVCMGNAQVEETKNSLIVASDRPVRALGVEDLVIVDGAEGLLIAKTSACLSAASFQVY
ncbi:MAG: sugar phosphate nucleotidyltransferase [Simkaniaceae bacterium]|nr:sugar phosphate nucleotidyltransferase [Candidatus Sacchlamyda saccharinae]